MLSFLSPLSLCMFVGATVALHTQRLEAHIPGRFKSFGHNSSNLHNFFVPKETIKTCGSVSDICTGPDFEFTPINILESRVLEKYGEWTKEHLSEHLTSDADEINVVGLKWFGVQEFDCSFKSGTCGPFPTCNHIAKYMKFPDEDVPCESDTQELRRRYFMALILKYQTQAYKALDDALEGARDDMKDWTPQIAQSFATQADAVAIRDCEIRKATIQQVIAAVNFAVGGIPITIGGRDDKIPLAQIQSALSLRVITHPVFQGLNTTHDDQKELDLASMVLNSLYVALTGATDFVSPLHLSQSQSAKSPDQILLTQIDTGICSDIMGGFKEQTLSNILMVDKAVSEMFEEFRKKLRNHIAYHYKSNAFLEENGESRLSNELKNYMWLGRQQLGDGLTHTLRKGLAKNVAQNIIGQVLRSSQCYISCLRLDSNDPYNTDGLLLNTTETPQSNMDLATFYPELVIADRENSTQCNDMPGHKGPDDCPGVVPTLQCQFACLQQSSSFLKPIWPPSLQKFSKFNEPLDSHDVFADAVMSHLAGVKDITNDQLMDQFMTGGSSSFRLPVCISDSAMLYNVSDSSTWDVTLDRFASLVTDAPFPWTWYGKGGFNYHCGDWKASETRSFLHDTPMGSNSANWKEGKIEGAWGWLLWDLNLALRFTRPITHFLTLCEADMRWPRHGHWYNLYLDMDQPVLLQTRSPPMAERGAEPICKNIREEIQDMSELEANLWFCNGPTARDVLWNEATRLYAVYTHHQMCHGLKGTPIRDQTKYPSEWYEDFATKYKSEISDYTQQMKEWEKNKKGSSVFRWKVKDQVLAERIREEEKASGIPRPEVH